MGNFANLKRRGEKMDIEKLNDTEDLIYRYTYSGGFKNEQFHISSVM